MGARRHVQTTWTRTGDGYVLGRYEIVAVGPRHWDLRVGGRDLGPSSSLASALAEARRAEQTHRRTHALIRNLALVGVALIVLLVALPNRMVPNDAHPPARAFAERLESAYGLVRSGVLPVYEVGSIEPGLSGGAVTTSSPIDLGGHGPITRYQEMLVGEHGGECYVIRWMPGGGPVVGVGAPALPCAVSEPLARSSGFVRSWSAVSERSVIRWEAVLPPAENQTRWFLPVVIGVAVLVLQGFVGATLALIRYARPRQLLPDLPPPTGRPVAAGRTAPS